MSRLGLRLMLSPLLGGGLALIACSQQGPEASSEGVAGRTHTLSGAAPLEATGDELEDAILGLQIRLRLLEHLRTEALGIEIGAERGAVTLSGTVFDRTSKSAAVEVASAVGGVVRISDRIALANAGARPPAAATSDDLERRIADAVLVTHVKLRLAERLGAEALDIDAEAAAGVVRLRGTVRHPERRGAALAALESVEGVREAHDELSVLVPAP